jgi:hypothetical protein
MQSETTETSTVSKERLQSKALQGLEEKILANYGEEVLAALKAALAVICSTSLKERANALGLIFEGASGRGKSLVINMCEPDREATRNHIYRLDTFTPKAFVSHAANIGKDELQSIDLLPKIKNKTLLTKELAPLFRGREEELRSNFATLTAVLDGKGHMSASGSQGTRGYHERHVFNWLGATTPIPTRTDAIMAQLGNRLLRYEIVGEETTEEELIEFARSYSPTTVEDSCREAANDLVEQHFQRHPLESVEPSTIFFPDDSVKELVRLAQLIAHGRVEVTHGEHLDDFTPGTPEGPQRIILLLRMLAQGSALLHGRSEVTPEDIEVIRHVAFSSLPRSRRQILRAVLTNGGRLTSKEAEQHLHMSRPTARGMMRELAATEIVTWTQGAGNEPDVVKLSKNWAWLLPSQESNSSS